MLRQVARRSFSMAANTTSAPFSRAVVNAMRKLYPESLAEKSWDNTGLLLEAPFDPSRRQKNSALLTIDLTKAVADEAIERRDSIIVAYHPIIFRGLKSLTLADTQQRTLLRLAAAGISVYSPHTALDAAPGGLGDWLADIVTGSLPPSAPTPAAATADADDPFTARPSYQLQHLKSQSSLAELQGRVEHERSPIVEKSNMGRLVRYAKPQPLSTVIARIATALGNPAGFPLAVPQGSRVEDIKIRSVAVCAGSGGGVFGELAPGDGDLLLTGELSHHEALAATENGKVVVALFHSNTERGFLPTLKSQLDEQVKESWEEVKKEGKVEGAEEEWEIAISEWDRDPYGVMINKDV